MGFFDSPKPRVTKEEMKIVRGRLYSNYNFTTKQLDQVEEIFRGDMGEQKPLDQGIDSVELTKALQWMRDHMDVHHIPIEKINALEVEMMKMIGHY